MLTCSQCGGDNQMGAFFCEMCGTRLTSGAAPAPPPSAAAGAGVACAACGQPAIPGEAFCDNCGTPLSTAPGAPQQQLPSAPPAQPAPQPVYPPPQPLNAATVSACSVCGTPAIPGEAFCDNCGAALPGAGAAAAAPPPSVPVAPTPGPAPAASSPAAPAAPQPPTPASLQGMSLEIAGSSIPLPARQEAVLGRQDPASGYFPDIDLVPYGAFESGVGRRHARLLLQSGQVLIEDLDSTNGTLVNRQRLSPRQPVPLNGGEEIRLGKLVLTFRRGAT